MLIQVDVIYFHPVRYGLLVRKHEDNSVLSVLLAINANPAVLASASATALGMVGALARNTAGKLAGLHVKGEYLVQFVNAGKGACVHVRAL